VLPSDVDIDQSRYSQSESKYRYSDGFTDLEASEEEGQATKKLTTDMLEQPFDNEKLVWKVENIIEQNTGATTKKPAIGKHPSNEETVCRPVVEIIRKHGVQWKCDPTISATQLIIHQVMDYKEGTFYDY
jgi:hypothetical protein